MPRTARAPLAAFFLLCLLGALGTWRGELAPRVTPSALPHWLLPAWPYLLAAFFAATYALIRRAPWLSLRQTRTSILIGLGLFVVPALTLSVVQQWIDPFTQVILLALTPIFAVVLEPHLDHTAAPPHHALAAAIAGAAGLLLVFPFQLPRSTAAAGGWLALLLAVLALAAANCRAVQLASLLPRHSVAPITVIATATSAIAFLVFGGIAHALPLPHTAAGASLLWSAIVDTPSLLLLFWLLPRLSASRITTRFVLSPLFSSLAGLILLRPTLALRDAIGLLLAAAGCAWLLLAPHAEPESPTSPVPPSRA